VKAVENVNASQKFVLYEKVRKHFKGDLAGKTFAIWGLAFKPRTDDMREAPAIYIIKSLLKDGAKVRASDPEAIKEARKLFGDSITYCTHPMEALDGADALLLVTEWSEFRNPDFDQMKERLKSPVIFDGRNIFPKAELQRIGFTYYPIGSGHVG
jgi:UDPglucose 6-dehydrogenase